MTEMVETFLNMSKLELGVVNFKKETINLKMEINKIVESFVEILKSKNILIKNDFTDKKIIIQSDLKSIQMIIGNLISNAIKYTRKGGLVFISLNVRDSHVLLSVKDNGIGIPKDAQDKIFSKFYRAGNAVSEGEGTGLGLYIVKAMTEKIGCKL